ncbi:receptor-like cytoplasmic kinase 176 isoform X2 [Salvia miltiorrhiza]|uniref:receptor-like cytoplasmic kinase 176 isoform X2 n=1 Tax=Salvia miltiorrhiza TaxID=226208 RepID=UPI0025AC0B78|nr:receptor-like cytoplasmic kinase 176 isoform X2 [Salvia miltiorrhiza]
MSRIYDSWEKLVRAVLRREEDRQIALRPSFSSSSSADVSSRSSFDSTFFFDPFFFGDVHAPSACRISGEKLDPAHLSSQDTFFFRNVMAIEYEEIRKATKNFTADLLVGEGGFGSVYKGWIDEHNLTAVKPGSGIAVAIKKMNHQGLQGHKEWVDEIHYLSQLHHPNLVKLIGYSCNKDERIVVYEFMPKGSLNNHLFTRGHLFLPWATRTKVAIGAARALAFLHNLEIPVIHRGINSRDFLLDGDFNTKLSDFGLARDGPTGDRTHVSTRVMGTYGYAAPEYMATGHLTTRCDVFGFGVVLLELMSGLRVIDRMRAAGKHNLMDWAKPYLKDKRRVSKIVDSRLMGKYPPKEARKVAKIVLQCVSEDPSLRPRMSEVVAELEKLY